jgi:hypothetical protein
MTSTRLLRFLGGVATAALIAHLLVAGVAAAAMRTFYPHRMFNTRNWPAAGAERFQPVGSFLVENAQRSAGPVIAVVGSSVAYGYPWQERFIFSKLIADRQPSTKVINASIIGSDATGISDFVLCAAFRNHVRFDAAIVEIPIVNTTSQLIARRTQQQPASVVNPCAPGATDPGYLGLAMTRPRGVGWFRVLSNSDARETKETPLTIAPLPKGSFATASEFDAVRQDYVAQVASMLRNAQAVADVVYAFPSPIYVGGLAEGGADPVAVTEQLGSTERACRSVAAVRCIQTSALWAQRQCFYNFTHLSQAGHVAMADLIVAAMTDGGATSHPVTP